MRSCLPLVILLAVVFGYLDDRFGLVLMIVGCLTLIPMVVGVPAPSGYATVLHCDGWHGERIEL